MAIIDVRKLAWALPLALLGCGGAQKPEPRNAGEASSSEDATAVLRQKPKTPEAHVSDDQRADFDKAVATYQKLRRGGGLKGADCAEAASAFRRVADDYPGMLIARHNEASVYLECGQNQEAMRIEEELARKNYAPALANMGYVAWKNGDSSSAESYFNRAIAADPQLGSIAARINLAQLLEQKARASSGSEREKNMSAAQLQLRSVLALDGNSLQAYASLCYIYYDLQLPDAAILVGRQAIKRAEEIATGKFEDEVVAETVNQNRAAAGRRGRGRREAQAEETAATPTTHSTNVPGTGWTPDMKQHIAVVHNTMGLIALDKRNYSDAIASFKKAVELNPELYEARLNLAAVSLRFRDYDTAEQNFKAVVTAEPKNYMAIIGYGVALRGNRKYEDAEQQYTAAKNIDPSRPESYFNLGLLYQEYKGTEKPTLQQAQRYYQDFITHSGSSGRKHEAEKRIKDIDELFVALAEADKLQKEAEEIQRKAEEQQKKMEEDVKRQDDAEKNKPGALPPGEAPAPATPPPSAVTPPPAAK